MTRINTLTEIWDAYSSGVLNEKKTKKHTKGPMDLNSDGVKGFFDQKNTGPENADNIQDIIDSEDANDVDNLYTPKSYSAEEDEEDRYEPVGALREREMDSQDAYELGLEGDPDALEREYNRGKCANIDQVMPMFEKGLRDSNKGIKSESKNEKKYRKTINNYMKSTFDKLFEKAINDEAGDEMEALGIEDDDMDMDMMDDEDMDMEEETVTVTLTQDELDVLRGIVDQVDGDEDDDDLDMMDDEDVDMDDLDLEEDEERKSSKKKGKRHSKKNNKEDEEEMDDEEDEQSFSYKSDSGSTHRGSINYGKNNKVGNLRNAGKASKTGFDYRSDSGSTHRGSVDYGKQNKRGNLKTGQRLGD